MAPGTVGPLRLASQVPICCRGPSRSLRRPILRSQGIDGEGLPRPSGIHTPNAGEETPGTFLLLGCSQELQIPSTWGTTSQPRATGLHVETGFPRVHFLTGTGRVSSSPRPANTYHQGQDFHGLLETYATGELRDDLSVPHIHPEGLVQVTLVSRSKLLSPPARLRTYSGWNQSAVKPLGAPLRPSLLSLFRLLPSSRFNAVTWKHLFINILYALLKVDKCNS